MHINSQLVVGYIERLASSTTAERVIMTKTLFFEGAGCVPRGEVENCRIRTAFTNDLGKRIYLEMTGTEIGKHSAPMYKEFVNAGFVTDCSYITDDKEENIICKRNTKVFEYTKSNILKFVNSLGCSFDAVVILPNLAGYRVFKETYAKGEVPYNYGDQFIYDAELTQTREEVKKHFYNLEKSEGKQYPNFSLWVDETNANQLHLLRHFNGYNKHWTITIGNGNWAIEETILGKCAC